MRNKLLIILFAISISSLSIYSEELVYKMFLGDNETGEFIISLDETATGDFSVQWDSNAVFKMLITMNYSLAGNAKYTSQGILEEAFVEMDAGSFGKHQLRIQNQDNQYYVWKRKDTTKEWDLRKQDSFEDITMSYFFPFVNKKIITEGPQEKSFLFYDIEKAKVREIPLVSEYYESPEFGQVFRLYNKSMEYIIDPKTGILLYNWAKVMGMESSVKLINS